MSQGLVYPRPWATPTIFKSEIYAIYVCSTIGGERHLCTSLTRIYLISNLYKGSELFNFLSQDWI